MFEKIRQFVVLNSSKYKMTCGDNEQYSKSKAQSKNIQNRSFVNTVLYKIRGKIMCHGGVSILF